MLGQIVLDGAARAAQLVPLLFALNNATPACAQLPRATTPAAEPPFASVADEPAPLTLTAHHLDVRIEGSRARIRSLLTYRNERTVPVSTSFAFPFPTLLGQGGAWRAIGTESIDPGGDESPAEAEFAEVGEPVPPRIDVGHVTVAPGEEIRIETLREVDLTANGSSYRLALPLPVDRSAPYVPQFSADVTVDEVPTVTRLASTTHAGTATGIGSGRARFEVPAGRAYLGTQFVVEIGVGAAHDIALWGGEARLR
ncbi:MAG: hypothetical protein ACM3PU_17040 [Gemmatimonadota bacterium]